MDLVIQGAEARLTKQCKWWALLPETTRTAWLEKLQHHLSRIKADRAKQKGKLEFFLDEILTYITKDDVRQGIVRENAERNYMSRVPRTEVDYGLQDPDTTFGQHLDTRRCPRCKSSTDVRWVTQQRRSIDEPITHVLLCQNCNTVSTE
jgi:DNA-directed RNA polymerase subunit M/transcription elongation factor TFIIS